MVEGYAAYGFFDRWNGYLLWSYDEGRFFDRQLVLAKALVSFFYLLLCGRVGLVHCHVAAHGSFFRKAIFATLARAFGRPVIWHLHGSKMKVFYEKQSAVGQLFIKAQFERADLVIVLSKEWRSFVASVSPAAKIAILPNCVSAAPGKGPRCNEEGDVAKGIHIVTLGLLGERKGSFDLIRAFKQVVAVHSEARLTLAGNGDVEAVRGLAVALGLEQRVSLPGWVSGDAKAALFASADIYVLPSYHEGLPVSVLEAMAVSLPVVTTSVGGLPDLIQNGVNGWLIPAGDINGLADILFRLIRDPSLRRSTARSGLVTIMGGYTLEAVMPRLDAFYAELSGQKGAQ